MASKILQYHLLSNKYYDTQNEIKITELLCKSFKNKRILEIGCGIGRLVPLIKEKSGVYTGIDNNLGFVKYCKRKYSSKFLKANTDKLPFQNEKFDIILYPWILPDVKNLLVTLKEGYRVLKNNGTVVIIDGTFNGEYGKLIKRFFKSPDHHRNLYFGRLRKCLMSIFERGYEFKQNKITYSFPNLEVALKTIIMELKYLERLKLTNTDKEKIADELKNFKYDDKVVINETVAFHKCKKL